MGLGVGQQVQALPGGFGSSDGFNTGFDLLDGVLNGWKQFEQARLGLELQEGAIQQQRLQNAVEVSDQINNDARVAQSQQTDWKRLAMLAGGVIVGTVLLVKGFK